MSTEAGSLDDEPERLARILRDALPNRTKVWTDVRGAQPPGVLVEPAPRRDYTVATAGGFVATWRILALGNPPADRRCARVLNQLADQVVAALEDDLTPISAEPTAYQPDQAGPVYPAILITLEGMQPW